MQVKSTEVGVVKALYRYPVKSMGGEEIDVTQVWWHGFEGDRKYAFVQSDNRSGFPWLTARQIPTLLRFQPYFTDSMNVKDSRVQVKTPSGQDLLLQSDALHQEIAKLTRLNFHLMQLGRGAVDSMAVSLISSASIQAIGDRIGESFLDVRRFRANVLVEPFDQQAFSEEDWLGGQLVFGERDTSARIHANRQNVRCMMINLDPDTAQQNGKILRQVSQERDECAGIYGSVQAPGTIQVGDVIRLLRF